MPRKAKNKVTVDQPITQVIDDQPTDEVIDDQPTDEVIDDQPTDEVTVDQLPMPTLKPRARKSLSAAPRDPDGRVIRKGVNLSGNVPWRRKYYRLVSKPSDDIKAPTQVRLILKYMYNAQILNERGPMRGYEIVEGAIAEGYLVTKIQPANLFAYYRRLLESFGVVESEPWNDDDDDGGEGEM